MRIMAISDTESTALWDHYNSNKITDTDLIRSDGYPFQYYIHPLLY